MITLVIPTLDAASCLPGLLPRCAGHSVVVTDGGSTDDTLDIALKFGAILAVGTAGRGTQLRRGVDWAFKAQEAKWVLILHADCEIPEDWHDMAQDHIANHETKAAYFTFGARASGWRPRFMEFIVRLRDIWPLLPYGDQGLLISREMYEAVGGYPDQALFEDVEIIRAIKRKFGRSALRRLDGQIMTDVSAYQRDGFAKRTWRNVMIMRDYNKNTPVPELVARYNVQGQGK